MKKILDEKQKEVLKKHRIEASDLGDMIELLPRQVTLTWTDGKGYHEYHVHRLKILSYDGLYGDDSKWIVSYEEQMGKGAWTALKDELIDALFEAAEYMIKQGQLCAKD